MMNEENNIENNDMPELPQPIKDYIGKYRKLAVILLVFFVVAAFIAKSWKVLILAVIVTPYCLLTGLMTERRWRTGIIREVPVVCTGVQFSMLDIKHKTLRVSFRSADDETEYFQFSVRDRKTFDCFIEDAPYVIYVAQDQPDTLIGFTQV